MRRISILILLLGFVPAFKTAISTSNYLSLFDYISILLGIIVATSVQEALDRKGM